MHILARLFLAVGTLIGISLATVMAEDDIAVAIVYDTSGSMTGQVKDAQGKSTPKYLIANRALENIVAQLEKFAATSPRKLRVGLYIFSGQGAKEVIAPRAFEPTKIRAWLADFKKPDGATPLGNATAEAAAALLSQRDVSRHVLVITDGENTMGPPPEQRISKINDEALKSGNTIAFHFIAFDVNASVFAAIKRQGATLLSAADEKQLNDRLTFVFEEKILLEKE